MLRILDLLGPFCDIVFRIFDQQGPFSQQSCQDLGRFRILYLLEPFCDVVFRILDPL